MRSCTLWPGLYTFAAPFCKSEQYLQLPNLPVPFSLTMLFVWFCTSSFPLYLEHTWSSLFLWLMAFMTSSIWITCSECSLLLCSILLPVSIRVASSMSSFASNRFMISLWFVSLFLCLSFNRLFCFSFPFLNYFGVAKNSFWLLLLFLSIFPRIQFTLYFFTLQLYPWFFPYFFVFLISLNVLKPLVCFPYCLLFFPLFLATLCSTNVSFSCCLQWLLFHILFLQLEVIFFIALSHLFYCIFCVVFF